jgi:DNA-binding CsgD family transcriptional regulator
MNRAEETTSPTSARLRSARCPYSERMCADRAATALAVVSLTGVAAVGVCLGRRRVTWSSGRTDGPVGAWMATAMRVGTTRSELFPGFGRAVGALIAGADGPAPFLTVLPGDRAPLPAEALVRIVDRGAQREPHLVLVTLRDYVDRDAGMQPFEVAILRSLVSDMNLETAITNADLRVTWASPAFEDRAGVGTLTGHLLTEITSAQERDALVDLARQVTHRRKDRPALSRRLPTGRRAGVADHSRDLAIAGLLWWWLPESSGGHDADRMAAIEGAVSRFVDDLAWAGVETTRLSARAVSTLSTGEILTPREREILELLSSGLRAPSIATRLYLSPSTVRNHLSTAFRKMGVTSQAEFFELIAAAGGPKRGRQRARPTNTHEP